MDGSKTSFVTMLLIGGFLVVGLLMVNGCKKDETPSPAAESHEGHEHSEMAMGEETASETTKEIAGTEQTLCPVMGGPIDKQYFAEYEGKKVYFCCPACVSKFTAEPEKYLSKLPQFKQ